MSFHLNFIMWPKFPTGAIQIHLRYVGRKHHVWMVLVSSLRADNAPETEIDSISSHENERISERICCNIYLVYQLGSDFYHMKSFCFSLLTNSKYAN